MKIFRKMKNILTGTISNLEHTSKKLDYIDTKVSPFIYEQISSRILADSKYNNPLRLEPYGYKVYSQNDEDGLLYEIFRRIGIKTRSFVEFGVGNGLENNSLYLLKQGWHGLWIEGSSQHVQYIKDKFSKILKTGQLSLIESFITKDNINTLIKSTFSNEIDLLSIDIDGNDYHIWQAIDVISPRVVCIEYNAKFVPPVKWTIEYNPKHTWDGSDYQGASLAALAELGSQKGYQLVGCNLSGINAFFVRKDLLDNNFLISDNLMDYYHPPRYYLRACLETSAFIVTRRHVDKKRLCAAAKTREDCQTVPQRSDGQRMGACTSSPAPCFWRRSEAQNRPA